MIHVLVHHKVSDFPRWKQAFDSHLNNRMHAGELAFRLFQNIDDQGDVTLLFDWDSVEHARGFLQSEELRGLMAQAGVLGAPEVTYLLDVRTVRRTAAD